MRTLLLFLAPLTLAAQNVSVSSANPNSAAQGTINLNVTISGKGFKNGAHSRFFVSGTTNPGGVVVNSTAFVSSSTLVANVTVSDTADIALFDIVVDNPDGREGHGTELFSVTAKGASAACVTPTLPSNVTLVGALNTLTAGGAPTYSAHFGKAVRARRTTAGGIDVILVAVVGNFGRIEVFFLDPVTGNLLDGTIAQPHLSIPTPVATFNNIVTGDFNADSIPDLAITNASSGAWAFLGQRDGSGILSFQAPLYLDPGPGVSGYFAWSIAAGDLDGIPGDEIASGSTEGKIRLFRYTGSGFTNYAVLQPPANGGSGFGANVAIGDVTGDSSPDVVASANGASSGNVRGAGLVWVFRGPTFTTSFSVSTGIKNDNLGVPLAVGNITGAPGGYVDLLAGAGADSRFLVYAGPVSTTSTPALTLRPGGGGDGNGIDAGDIDGDGLADVLSGHVGSVATGPGCPTVGAAYLFRSSQGFTPLRLVPPAIDDDNYFGWALSVVPGTQIVVVSDRDRSLGGDADAGQVFVYKVN
jgi:hypothetical protein